jgi:hypothetical protein
MAMSATDAFLLRTMIASGDGAQPLAGACSVTNEAMRCDGTPDRTSCATLERPLQNYTGCNARETRRRDLVQAVDPETEGSAGDAEDRQPRKLREFVHRGLPESGETVERQATHERPREMLSK